MISKVRRVTSRFMKRHREEAWKKIHQWEDNDMKRTIRSQEARPEQIQDFEKPMVIIGSDVVALYPNLEIKRVTENVKEAIRKSGVRFEEVDYLEGARYLALNWSADECRKSKLGRILPRRRHTQGSRPGMRGEGPRSKVRGCQEQWIFPKIKLEDWEKESIIAEVIGIATKAMFNHHYYSFGGRKFHQEGGGPIGLRGTCSIARMIMQLYDDKWMKRMTYLGLTVWLLARYMDDTRVLMPEIKPGWRWKGGELLFSQEWREKDSEKSGTLRTKEILLETFKGIEDYLDFTVETGEEFPGGWLPTLDTSFKVAKDNQVLFRYFEKPMTSSKTVQQDSAMEENAKLKTLSMDLIRRFLNSCEALGREEKKRIVDEYSTKLINSGFSKEKTAQIIVNGIKGYEMKIERSKRTGVPLRRSAKLSSFTRRRKKLLGKSSWFRSKKSNGGEEYDRRKGRRREKEKVLDKEVGEKRIEQKTVLFLEQTPRGELAVEMRNLIARLAPTLGFSIKVVERTGTSIRNKFSQGSLWEGTLCGREDCTPCSQDTEEHPPCTRVSVLYENICKDCNPEAVGKGDIKIKTGDTPSIYVGESSRSLQERGKEHQGDYKARSEKNHMHKHRMVHHNGEDPQFILKAVKYFKTALSRQTAEAIRIRRRGGESGVLNSKAEYNRCFIPRLTVLDEKSVEEMEELEKEDDKRIQEEIDRNQESWEGGKSSKRAEGIRKELDKIGIG